MKFGRKMAASAPFRICQVYSQTGEDFDLWATPAWTGLIGFIPAILGRNYIDTGSGCSNP
jgi:hypothetical protein